MGSDPDPGEGPRATLEAIGRFSAAFEAEETIAAGDRCGVRWLYRWVDGEGTPGHVRGVDVFRVRDGKVPETLSYVKG